MKKAAFMLLVASFLLLAVSSPSLARNPAKDARNAQIDALKKLIKTANAQKPRDKAEIQRLNDLLKQIKKASPSV